MMPDGRKDIMAQAVYLAQLEAAKGNCKCRVCQIMRKASNAMTEQFLAHNPGPATPETPQVFDPTAFEEEKV